MSVRARQRSHPPALLKRTLRTLREETSLQAGDIVLVGVSGGGDSGALLHVLARLSRVLQFSVFAHGVDHGLRPDASSELDLAQGLAERCQVPFTRSHVQLEPGGNLQARARLARYAELDDRADQLGARWVATAHHADDRAETLLLRLLRGTGTQGLSPLAAQSPRRLRPFIRSPKAAVLAHLERHEIAFAEDPSNRNPRFLRTRVRHELLPLMEQLAPGIQERLNQLADDCKEWGNYEELNDARALAPTLETEPNPQLGPAHLRQIRRARKLNRGGAEIWLPGGVSVRVDLHTGRVIKTQERPNVRAPKKPAAVTKAKPRGCQSRQK